jgi:membrane fusion protein (multidrug efflux system)
VPTPFSRTLRSLGAERGHRAFWGLVVGASLLAGWALWASFAEVPVYETTDAARLEVEGGIHVVQAPVDGRVVGSSLELGARVEQGTVLVELDATELDKALDEERATQEAVAAQLAALDVEIQAEREALGVARDAEAAAVAEALARENEIEPSARFAERRADRLHRMQTEGVATELEVDEAKSDAEARRAAIAAARRGSQRVRMDHERSRRDRLVALARLDREATRLRAEATRLAPVIARLEHEIDLRRIRAPRTGVLGRIVELRHGAFVEAAQELFTVVPEDQSLRVVAQYEPSEALGRIQPGQTARLRLAGFPWAQYGMVTARVARIGSEAPDGRVRVELDVDRQSASRIPLEHGLETSVEVEVERVAPAVLLLRAAGKLLDEPRAGG